MVKVEHELWNIKQTMPEFYVAICQSLTETKIARVGMAPGDPHNKFIEKHDLIEEPPAYCFDHKISDNGNIEFYYLVVTDSQVVEPPFRDLNELFNKHKHHLTKNYIGEWYWTQLEVRRYDLSIPTPSLTALVYEAVFDICNTFEEYQRICPLILDHLKQINENLPDFIRGREYNRIATHYAKYGTFLERLELYFNNRRGSLNKLCILDYDFKEHISSYIASSGDYYIVKASIFNFDDISFESFIMLSQFEWDKRRINNYIIPLKYPRFKGFPLIVTYELFDTYKDAETYLKQQIKRHVLQFRSTWGIEEHALNFRYRPQSNLRELSDETKETFGIKLFDYTQ